MATAVVTGASGGIGLEVAKELVRRGYDVYCLSRGAPPTRERIAHIPTDVLDDAAVALAFERIATERGQIDMLINNVGMGISGAVEFTDIDEARRLFDINFFGTIRCAQRAIPLMRKRGGAIVNISSAAAIFSIPFQAYYSASKAAVNSLTLSLRSELRAFPISVCAVMPGDVKTGFTAARRKYHDGEDIYGGVIGRSVGLMERDEERGMDACSIARYICNVAEKKHPRPLYTPGLKYKLFALLAKLLPARFVNAVVAMMYIKKP